MPLTRLLRIWCFILCLIHPPAAESAPFSFEEGDLLFQVSSSSQSRAIQIATGSAWSHCGLVLKKDGTLQVFEAVKTVRWTPLDQWIKRGTGQRLVLMRLKDRAPLSAQGLAALRKSADALAGKPYDLLFQWSDEKIYCSELVWKAYRRGLGIELAPLRRFGDYALNHEQVQKIIRERYGRPLPEKEAVVSPADLMHSPLLKTVGGGEMTVTP